MQSLKGAWFSPTFALAKSNDSGGKKARIRRSKEERKAMVESFIKKHQNLNNGSFPSLNLTHKEVGGSFYTIREIVRDVIQENKVLGPAKLKADEKNIEQLVEQNPLGSISMEPAGFLSNSNEISVVPDFQFDGVPSKYNGPDSERVNHKIQIDLDSGESGKNHVTNSYMSYTEDKTFNDRPVMKGTDETIVEPRVKEHSGAMEAVEEAVKISSDASTSVDNEVPLKAMVLATADDEIAEAVATVSESLNGQSDNVAVNQESSGFETETEVMKDGTSKTQLTSGISFPSNMETVVVKSGEDSPSDKVYKSVEKETKCSDSLSASEGSDSRITKRSISKASSIGDKEVAIIWNANVCSSAVGQKHLAGNGEERDDLSYQATRAPSDRERRLRNEEVEVINDKVKVQNSAKFQGSSNTLNRIKPESWDDAKSMETNPLLAILKSLAAAFIKFWSE